MELTRKAVFVIAVMFALTACTTDKGPESLPQCFSREGYEAQEVFEFPDTPSSHTLSFGDRAEPLSVKEGYRYTFHFRGQKFLDVTMEYPGGENYPNDKQVVSEYYQFLKMEKGMAVEPISSGEKHLTGYTINRQNLSSENQFLSLNCIFDDKQKRIVYVYYWNTTSNRQFQTIEEFLQEKQQSFTELLACLSPS